MIYTKHTTEKEYADWLATNPMISEILRVQRAVLAIASGACDQIINFCKRKFTRKKSCLWKGAVKEPTSATPQGIRNTEYPAEWGEDPDKNYQYRCKRMFDNVQAELAMEGLYCEALEILTK